MRPAHRPRSSPSAAPSGATSRSAAAHGRLAHLGLAVVVAALVTALLPAIPAIAKGPVKVRGEEVSAAVDHRKVIPLPFEASHVALRWQGSHDDRLSISFGQLPNALGEEVPVAVDEDAEGDDGEVSSGVIWTGGARFARVTTDRPIGALKLLVMDAVGDRGPALGGGTEGSGPATGGGFLFGDNVANAAVGMPAIISRAGWGANEAYRFDSGGYERFPPHFNPLQKVIVHHTAGRNDDPDPEATIRAIYYMHAVGRGYGDIDYNYLIDWQGRVYEGRHARDYAPGEPITGEDLAGNVVRGAHAKYFNDGTVGIALLGMFTDRLPPAAQQDSLERLLAWKLERHGLNPLGAGTYTNPELGNSEHLKNISGHRDVSATACPGGALYNWFPTLRRNVADRIAATTGSAVDHTAPAADSLLPMTPSPTGATALPFGLLFREPVTGLDATDFTVGGTSPGWTVASVGGTASGYTVTLAAPEGPELPPEGSVTVTLVAEAVTDLAGNLGPTEAVETAVDYAHDPDAPTVVLWQTPHRTIDNAEFFDWTVAFSEPVIGFEAEDIAIGGPDAAEWKIGQLFGTEASYAFTTKQPTLTDGTFTISIPEGAATDLAGNPVAASGVITMKVDRTAPRITGGPSLTLLAGTTLSGSSPRARLAWKGGDSGPAGIASYDIARSIDGGSFSMLVTGVTGSFRDLTVAPGHSYRFEVRARDRAGNISAWKVGPTLQPALVQQTSSSIHWSGAVGTTTSTSFSGGSTRYLASAGASATFTTKARALSFVTTKGPNRGAVRIYVDGVLATTVDLNAASTTYRYVAFSKRWASLGTHTIRVVAVGGATPRVDVDAFGVIR